MRLFYKKKYISKVLKVRNNEKKKKKKFENITNCVKLERK